MARRILIFRKEKRGNAAAQSAPAWLFGSMMIYRAGKVFKGDVDAGSPQRSQVAAGASVHQSRNAEGGKRHFLIASM